MRISQRVQRIVGRLLRSGIGQHVLRRGKRCRERLPRIRRVIGLDKLVRCHNGILQRSRVHVRFRKRALRGNQRLKRPIDGRLAFRIHQLRTGRGQRLRERRPRFGRVVATVELLGRRHCARQCLRVNCRKPGHRLHGHRSTCHVHTHAVDGHARHHVVRMVARVRRIRCARCALDGRPIAEPLVRYCRPIRRAHRRVQHRRVLAFANHYHAGLVKRHLRLNTQQR